MPRGIRGTRGRRGSRSQPIKTDDRPWWKKFLGIGAPDTPKPENQDGEGGNEMPDPIEVHDLKPA